MPIEASGGTLFLQCASDELGGKKEDTIIVDVPLGAVSPSAGVKMHYAIIPEGPFALPEGFQFGSMVVYIYFDGRHVTQPLRLHLPHWYGGKDYARDCLSFAVAPHSLEEGKGMYHFEVMAGGEFPESSNYGEVEIGGHCSLFAAVFKVGATPNYQITCLEKENRHETVCDIAVTYASLYWPQVIILLVIAFVLHCSFKMHALCLCVYIYCLDLAEIQMQKWVEDEKVGSVPIQD